MLKLPIFLFLFLAIGLGQNCIKYGAPTTLNGTLLLRDEAGYNQFIAFKPVAAICTVADPKDVTDTADPYYRRRSGVKEVQAGVYGGDSASAALRDRLNRLIGYRVVIKGDVFPATTGYDRTNVVLRVTAVDAADPSGQQALLAPRTEIKAKDVDVYDVTVNAGKRLVIDAHESGSTIPLLPTDRYVTHWMTGGEVVYLDCGAGYERKLLSSTAKDGGSCFQGNGLCGISAFPNKPVIIKLRCTKKQ